MRNSAASSISTITVLYYSKIFMLTEISFKMGYEAWKGGRCFYHSNTGQNGGSPDLKSLRTLVTGDIFFCPLTLIFMSACYYPTASLSPWPSRLTQKSHTLLISFAVPPSAVFRSTPWASQQGKNASRLGIHLLEEGVWILRIFFSPHYSCILKNHFNNSPPKKELPGWVHFLEYKTEIWICSS